MGFIDNFFNAFYKVFYVGIFITVVINLAGLIFILAMLFGFIKM